MLFDQNILPWSYIPPFTFIFLSGSDLRLNLKTFMFHTFGYTYCIRQNALKGVVCFSLKIFITSS